MNYANTQQLIDRLHSCDHTISNTDKHFAFNMIHVAFPDSRPSCIAGHCGELMGQPRPKWGIRTIQEFLEITYEEASHIFHGGFAGCDENDAEALLDVDQYDAADHLDQLRGRYIDAENRPD